MKTLQTKQINTIKRNVIASIFIIQLGFSYTFKAQNELNVMDNNNSPVNISNLISINKDPGPNGRVIFSNQQIQPATGINAQSTLKNIIQTLPAKNYTSNPLSINKGVALNMGSKFTYKSSIRSGSSNSLSKSQKSNYKSIIYACYKINKKISKFFARTKKHKFNPAACFAWS